jgi:hypothetical protein
VTGLPWRPAAGGITLAVRLTPRGGRDAIGGAGVHGGEAVLNVRVASAPVGGAANRALCRLIAASLGVPAGAVTIVAGDKGRLKRLAVAGDPALLVARLAALSEA